ncbi:unnamed protein product [Rhodiola kirilowii]
MAFWGIEAKPGNPYTHLSKTSKRKASCISGNIGDRFWDEQELGSV